MKNRVTVLMLLQILNAHASLPPERTGLPTEWAQKVDELVASAPIHAFNSMNDRERPKAIEEYRTHIRNAWTNRVLSDLASGKTKELEERLDMTLELFRQFSSEKPS